jgi:hypothetical protein
MEYADDGIKIKIAFTFTTSPIITTTLGDLLDRIKNAKKFKYNIDQELV